MIWVLDSVVSLFGIQTDKAELTVTKQWLLKKDLTGSDTGHKQITCSHLTLGSQQRAVLLFALEKDQKYFVDSKNY